ncbi:MAG TPA: hypothetical protein PLG59_06100 [bacterium]|nr:hypothetical protein [bacterium]HQP99765.1 hypothetical protein [bacterium]
MRIAVTLLMVFAVLLSAAISEGAKPGALSPTVEVEEEVYSYQPANNGANPMWCHGNTSIVRIGKTVFASGIETIPDASPLNNCLPMLFQRTEQGWERIYKGEGRTREPSPLVAFHDSRVFLSLNPTLTEPNTYGGPARPEILEFSAKKPKAGYETLLPKWNGEPKFTEHSYRSFVADGKNREMILFQDVGYTHSEWAFRDRDGNWSAQGKLVWPYGAEYDTPQPIRTCYPAVALKDRAVYFCGVSDIVEPYKAWREYKFQITGQKWDYDFRRLFYCWSDDITTGKFHDWVEISSRDKTCGWVFPMDMYVSDNGDVFVLWSERAIDERLREKFFPNEKQRFSLEYALIRDGKVIVRKALVEGGEDLGGERTGDGRFHVTQDGRLHAFYYVNGTNAEGASISEHRLTEIFPDGNHGEPVLVKLETPLRSFFTATIRGGCKPSNFLDLFGDTGSAMRYVRIRLK